MWNLFGNKPLLSDDDRQFQIECYRWLLTHFGGDDFYKEAKLVLPTAEFSPTQVKSQDAAAIETFMQVKKHAGLAEWPCQLQAQEEDPNLLVAPTVALKNVEENPLGAFSGNDNKEVIISYNPIIVLDPTQMVATFAHELSHYLTSTAPEPPPGGWGNWEFATDICATFLGFGIFSANATFNFSQYTGVDSPGWQVMGGGYLSEAEHAHAFAIFLRLKEISPETAFKHCDTSIKSYLKIALAELDKHSIIDELREVEYMPRGA